MLKRLQGGYWRFSEKVLKEKIANDEIIWGEGESYPMIKRFLSETQDGLVPTTFFGKEIDADFDEEFAGIFKREFAGDTAFSKREIDQLMHVQGLFEYIKPTKLIKLLMQIGTNKDDIILDFFSGSATTAHAVMAQNAQDGGNRKFIIVQLPELCDEKSEAYKVGYKTICDIGSERIRRAGTQIKQKYEAERTSEQPLDTGFRVLELDSSNFPIWDDSPIDPNALDVKEQLKMRFDRLLQVVKPERSHQDIIFEIILKYGWPLDLKIYPLPINGKKFYYIGKSEGDVLVIIAIDSPFEPEDAEEMIKYLPVKIVALDTAFKSDEALINCDFIFKDNEVSFDKI
ncbi:adenine specific DNA methylase Mod [Bartonella japonica]|uniref:site-specific DNA-methyltransferase (adenine-specific) n=1 Tax=Bartonella japonica TaxID=357761 RepID=A0ABV2FP39_9HYPH